ncbi:hypothetical protein BDV19DRAFT_390568 [Aspergillus venezuelensis]
MSGAEVVAGLGVAASALTIIDSCRKVAKLVHGQRNEVLTSLDSHVALLAHDIQRLRNLNIKDPPHSLLGPVLGGCNDRLTQLADLVSQYRAMDANVSRSRRLMGALKFSKLETEIQSTWAIISEYRSTITLHLVIHTVTKAIPDSGTDVSRDIWINMPRQGRDVVKRQQVIDSILRDSANSKARPCLITLFGVGGIGKTQIAIDFCWQVARQYSVIAWIPASSDASIAQGLAEFADTLSNGDRSFRTIEERLVYIKQVAARRTRPWLFVFDDYESSTDEPSICAALKDGRQQDLILTTARAKPTWGMARKVPRMSENEGLELAFKSSFISPSDDELASARNMLRVLDGLPLAIAHLAAISRSNGTAIGTQLQDLSHTLKRTIPSSSMADALEVTLQTIRMQDAGLLDFLVQLTIFNPDGITEDLFHNYFEVSKARGDSIPEYFRLLCRNDRWESSQFLDVIMRLSAFAMIEATNEQDKLVIRMHRLVHDAISRFIDENTSRLVLYRGAAILSANLTNNNWETFSLPYRRVFVERITHWSRVRDNVIDEPSQLRMYGGIQDGYQTTMAAFLAVNGNKQLAENLLHDALRLQVPDLGASASRTICTARVLANLHLMSGELDAARVIIQRLSDDTNHAYTSQTPDHYTPLLLKGQLEMYRGDLKTALVTFQECTRLFTSTCGTYHLSVATTLVSGAEILLICAKLEESFQLICDAQQIAEASSNPACLATRIDWNLARVLFLQGDHLRAIKHYEKLIAECKSRFGIHNHRWRTLQCELGDVYRELGITDKSRLSYDKGAASLDRKTRTPQVGLQDICRDLVYCCTLAVGSAVNH